MGPPSPGQPKPSQAAGSPSQALDRNEVCPAPGEAKGTLPPGEAKATLAPGEAKDTLAPGEAKAIWLAGARNPQVDVSGRR